MASIFLLAALCVMAAFVPEADARPSVECNDCPDGFSKVTCTGTWAQAREGKVKCSSITTTPTCKFQWPAGKETTVTQGNPKTINDIQLKCEFGQGAAVKDYVHPFKIAINDPHDFR